MPHPPPPPKFFGESHNSQTCTIFFWMPELLQKDSTLKIMVWYFERFSHSARIARITLSGESLSTLSKTTEFSHTLKAQWEERWR